MFKEGMARTKRSVIGVNKRVLPAIICLSMMLPLGLASQTATDPADMQKYIDEIRQYGMSEAGKGHLLMIASIRNGFTELVFPQGPDGSYGMSYTSLLCKNPSMDPDVARRERQEAETKNGLETIRLKPLADSDRSGFVTTEEAWQFRQLVEFVYKIAHVSARESNDMQRTCKALGMFEDAVRQRLADYAMLQERLQDLGLAPLPVVTLK